MSEFFRFATQLRLRATMESVWCDFGRNLASFLAVVGEITHFLYIHSRAPYCHLSQVKEQTKLVYTNVVLNLGVFRNFDFWYLEGKKLQKRDQIWPKNRAYSLPICPNLLLSAKSGKFGQFCNSKLVHMSEIGSDFPEPGLSRDVTFLLFFACRP